jgi:type VI protein secretion system component Hcp
VGQCNQFPFQYDYITNYGAALFTIIRMGPSGDGTAALDYDVYLWLDSIKGESTVKNYEDWIVLTGVQ